MDKTKAAPGNTAVQTAAELNNTADTVAGPAVTPDNTAVRTAFNEILALAREAGFKNMETLSTSDLTKRYFVDRTDHLTPASGEEFLVATV